MSEAKQKELALKDRETALTAAQRAERERTDELWRSYRDRARALRFGGQVGRRFDSLKTLGEATRIARSLKTDEDEILKLRNEAVACLALADLRFERTLLERRHLGNEYWIAFDPPFHHFVYSDAEGNLSVRQVADGQEMARLAGPGWRPAWVGLRFSPDGHWLAVSHGVSGRPPHQFHLWESREGKLSREVRLEQAEWCEFSADSRLAAAVRADHSIGIHEVVSGREIKRLARDVHPGAMRFHPDGRQLAVAFQSGGHFIAVLNWETGKEAARFEHPQAIGEMSWRGDGRLLAVNCNDQRIYVWDTVSRQLQSVLEGHQGLGIHAQFSHGGDFLISRSWDLTIRLWDPVSGRELVRGTGHFVNLCRDDRQVAVIRGNQVELWEVAGGRECRTLHHGQVGNRTARPEDWGPRSVDIRPDGRMLISASLDGTRLWDLATFAEVAHLPSGATGGVLVHPDGDSLFTYGKSGLHRWPIRREPRKDADHPDGQDLLQVGPPQKLDAPGNWFYVSMSCDRKGRHLAVVDYSHGRVVVLDRDEPVRKMVLPNPGVAGCVVSPDGRWAVTEARHGGLKAWDLSTGKVVWELPQTSTSLWGFTPDSLWLLTSSPEDNSDRLWQVGSWQPGPVIPRQQKRGPAARHGTAGEVFMTWDFPPKLIHAATGKELATLEAPDDNRFVSAQHSPDGALLAVATGNHTVHVWDLRAIRRGLAEIGLDWDLPPYRPAPRSDARPLRVEVQPAKAPPKEEKKPAPKK